MAKGGAMKKSKYMARGGAMKMAKGMARGGAMKGVKGRAKGGRVGGMGNIPKSVLKALALGAGAGLAGKAVKMPTLAGKVAKKPQKAQAVQRARLQAKKSPNETVVVARRRKGTLAPGKPGSRKR
jgi:hypothetical protein